MSSHTHTSFSHIVHEVLFSFEFSSFSIRRPWSPIPSRQTFLYIKQNCNDLELFYKMKCAKKALSYFLGSQVKIVHVCLLIFSGYCVREILTDFVKLFLFPPRAKNTKRKHKKEEGKKMKSLKGEEEEVGTKILPKFPSSSVLWASFLPSSVRAQEIQSLSLSCFILTMVSQLFPPASFFYFLLFSLFSPL